MGIRYFRICQGGGGQVESYITRRPPDERLIELSETIQSPADGRNRLYGPDSLAADGNGIDVNGMKKDSWIQHHFLE